MSGKTFNTNCPKCGRKAAGAASGSITQWLVACNCSLVEDATSGSDVSFCTTCGKRISAGRAGSLTQWIFRSDLCRCPNPAPGLRPRPSPSAENKVSIDNDIDAQYNLPFNERYKIIRELGFGGAGRVVLCFDTLLKKQVAVKQSIELNPKQAIEFQNEARAISKLKHPNIVEILDFGADEGRPYIVMSFIEGMSLTQHIQEYGPFPEDIAVALFIKLLDALSHSHRAGILHRDIKSSNVIITNHAGLLNVILIDFGIASKIASPTKSADLAGTPAYMAPEQFSGNGYDQRSEIYSVGCMLFEALSGQLPFVGETALQTVSMHATTPMPSHTNVTGRMERIVGRALEKEPGKRFHSAHEMRNALIGIEDSGEPELLPLTEPINKTEHAPYLIPVTAFALIALSSVGFWVFNLVQDKPVKALKPKPTADLIAFLDDDSLEPRFEKAIGRGKIELANKVQEKIFALNTALQQSNKSAAKATVNELLAAQKLCQDDPLTTAAIMTALSAYNRDCKQYAEALKLAKGAIEIYDQNPPPTGKLCEAYAEAGTVCVAQNDRTEGQKYFNRAVQLIKESPKYTAGQLILLEVSFDNAVKLGDTKSAEVIPAILENLATTRTCPQEDVCKVMVLLSDMARTHNLFKLEDDLLSRATLLIPDDLPTAKRFSLFENLSRARLNAGQYRSAAKAAQEAELYCDGNPTKMGGVAGLYNLIAYRLRGVSNESADLHGRALKLCELGPGKNSPPAISTLIQMSDVCLLAGKSEKSSQLLRLASSRCKKSTDKDVDKLIEAIKTRCRLRNIKDLFAE